MANYTTRGVVCEQNIIFELKKELGGFLVDVTGTDSDLYEGTDFLYSGIRYDTTLNREKDNFELIGSYSPGRLFVEDIQIGIRCGNSCQTFEIPVCVIMFPETLWERIVDSLEGRWDDVLEYTSDLYMSWIESHGIILPETDPLLT